MLPLRIEFEPLERLLDAGLAEHIQQHWDEVGVHKADVPLSVDWERYHALEKQGVLRLLGARRGDELVGYSSFLVIPHLHYSTTLHALNDAIWVQPDARGAGVRLIREAERLFRRELKPGHVLRIMYHVKFEVEKERGTLLPVFERLGYAGFETCCDKIVRAEP